MALMLYYHPFSSYSWKALIPLYEAETPLAPRRLDDPQIAAEWKRRWPTARQHRRSSMPTGCIRSAAPFPPAAPTAPPGWRLK